MAERRCQKVHCRSQAMLLPPCVDDCVSEHNTVRAIDALVGTLDLQALGFERTEATGGAGETVKVSALSSFHCVFVQLSAYPPNHVDVPPSR